MNKLKNQVREYYIEIYSPVHVGSGVKLRRGVDFFSAEGMTWLVDQQALTKALKDSQQALEDFVETEEPDIHEIATRYKFLDHIASGYYTGEVTATEMFEFVRNGTGIPFLPGSSIKGSIRTVLLWTLSQESGWQALHNNLLNKVLQERDERTASTPLVEKAFNIKVGQKRANDANRNLMRALHITDAHFMPKDLILSDARIFNVLSETQMGWKNLSPKRGQNRNEEEAHKATQVAAEALRIGAVTKVEITFDDFLLHYHAVQKEASFSQHAHYLENLPAVCNEYAKRQIAVQRQFFANYNANNNLKDLIDFYNDLESLCVSLSPRDFLLRLSWGSGWQGMTGELFDDNKEMERIRRRFNLGKFVDTGASLSKCPICGSANIGPDRRNRKKSYCNACRHSFRDQEMFPIFPKTRKISLQAGQPRYPFGWVLFRQEQPESKPPDVCSQRTPPPYKIQPQLKVRPERVAEKVLPPIPKPPLVKQATAISVGEKLRAEVIRVAGTTYEVQLQEKDAGRILKCSAMLAIPVGSIIQVRIEAVADSGTRVTKIAFSKLITKR